MRVTTPAEIAAAPPGAVLELQGYEHGASAFTTLVLIRAAHRLERRWTCSGLGPRATAALAALRGDGPTIRIPATSVVQGPMANVAEDPGLARAVCDAGALPFCALGALDPDAAADVLASFAALPRWGAGLIGFDVMPWRDAHLALLQEHDPDAVIVAGGSPALAARMQADGMRVWLHTPSPRLARMALRRGVDGIVLEGHEAGGHVGKLSSLQLWEAALDEVEAHGEPVTVVLAGGIGDPVSAAIAAAMGATAGVDLRLQAGTAFLLTPDAAVTEAYRQAALDCDDTVLVGATVNLPLRCAPNAYTADAIAREHALLDQDLTLRERREAVEHHNLGRTRIAAKGIERDPSGQARYRDVPAERQHTEGAFSLGQGAVLEDTVRSAADVVRRLSVEAEALLRPSPWGGIRPVAGDPSDTTAPVRGPVVLRRNIPIAIVGVGCVMPDAPDVAAWWHNLAHGVDSIRPIPADRWDPSRYWDPRRKTVSTTSSQLAAAVREVDFDPLAFGIPPAVVPTLDRAQQLALIAASQAVQGWRLRDPARAAVVLGNSMGGEHTKSLSVRVRFKEVLAAVRASMDLSDDAAAALLADVEGRLDEQLPPIVAESVSGLLANVIAGRIARWLDWMGGNLVVDAACAASLAATSVAVDWLRSGRCDAVLTGGVDTDLSPETFVGFSATHALTPGQSTPFSTRADGFVMGEGCAILALKRLDDALEDGDPVWAVLRGIGQSSDGRARGITAPRADGQRLALQRAAEEAGFGPERVGLVEAHGTGTAVGDATEVGVLTDHFADRRDVWLGSVKSQIGHLKGAAGAAGLLKATLSVATGVVTPTLHAAPLSPALRDGPFRLPRQATRLDRRVAAVSAFGFGGTNFHVLLDAPPDEARLPDAVAALQADAPLVPVDEAAWSPDDTDDALLVLAYGGTDLSDLRARITADAPVGTEDLPGWPHRVVLVTTPERRDADRTTVAAWVGTGPTLGRSATYSHGDVEPVVLLAPGQGSQRPGALASVGRFGPTLTDDAEGADPLTLHRTLFATAVAWAAVLDDAGVPVQATLGHSVGELAALVAGRHLDAAAGMRLAEARGSALQACPPGAMRAVRMAPEHAGSLDPRLTVAVVNSPTDVVLAGPIDVVDAVKVGRRVAVERAFHSPGVRAASEPLWEAVHDLSFGPGIAWSVATAAPFTDPPRELVDAITAPVRFADAIGALGPVTYVELGPGRTLSSFVERTLPDALAVPLDPDPSDPDGIVYAAARLLALGHTGLLARVRRGRIQRARSAPRIPVASTPSDDVTAAVVQAISAVTGYPPDHLRPDVDLEAELGVDSIKKLEILGLLEDRFGFRTPEADYAALERVDIHGLVAHVHAHLGSTVAATSDAGVHLAVLRRRPASPAGTRWTAPSQTEDLLSLPDDVDVVVTPVGDPAGAGAFARSVARERGRSIAVVDEHGTEDHWQPVTSRPIGVDGVVLATGGTRGIVRACLEGLRHVVVLGRTAPDDLPAGWTFVPGDVTVAADVRRAADIARERGPIALIVHGAGVLRDKPFAALTPEDVHAVLAPKLIGARNLLDVDCGRLVLFSSLVAATGNAHQSAYAAANAALLAVRHPKAPTSHLLWSAWSDIGMAADPLVQRILTARGVVPFDPASGRRAFWQALGHDEPVVVTATPFATLPWPLGALAGPDRVTVPLDPADVELDHHRLQGRALVPAALWVRALEQAAVVLDGPGPRTVTDFVVRAPTFVDASRSDVTVVLRDGIGRILAGETVVAEGRVMAGETPSITKTLALEGERLADPYDVLFHGPVWQVLRVVRAHNGTLTAELHLDPDAVDPVAALVDGAHQLLSIGAGRATGRLGLPVGAGRWEVGTPGRGAVRVAVHTTVTETGVSGEIEARDEAGNLLLRGRDVQLRAAGTYPDA